MTTLDPRGPLPARASAPDGGLAQEYLAEYRGRLAAIRQDLLAIAKGAAAIDEEQLVNRVFRAVHSIRGAGFFGFAKISELAQKMEDALALLRARKMVPKPYQVGILMLAGDRLRELIENSGTSNRADIVRIVAALGRLDANFPPAGGSSGVSPPARFTDGSRPRVLAVEDDLASRLLLKAFLSRYGECDVAADGREAVEAFRAAAERGQRYDLICMDLMMPEMDGREAVRQVRALEETGCICPASGAKIVIMTAVEEIKEIIGCFQDFCDAYLIKPVNLVNLLKHLRSWQLVP